MGKTYGKTKEEHLQGILEVLEKNPQIKFFSQIFTYYTDIGLGWAYQLGLNENEDIKRALEEHRVAKKDLLKEKWLDSDNPTLAIAAFKLIADKEELERLTTSSSKVEAKVDAQASFKSVDDWKEYVKGLNE